MRQPLTKGCTLSIPADAFHHGSRQLAAASGTLGGVDESQVYAAIGEDGFSRLVGAFYRQVPGDDVLGPMYPLDDLANAEVRLRDFLIGRFGGPLRYIEARGHPRLRMRHAPFAITPAARDRWLQLMTRALDEVRLAPPADAIVRAFFADVSTMMINRP